ncbi:hypothetical protein [Rahnella perminowiae]|uniref:hypothetical protein n=1 Tax=Rahnella perminowiae TaxID=2816244 RepID=UPI00215C1865|nr:hypothetical protein [Rahnella perminowiae]MCR9003530.1 hypothetical protein [Rahnella perminowiae]
MLELANPDLEMNRKEKRAEFRQEIEATAKGSANQDEIQRNREFIALQDMLPVALTRTRSEDVGKNSLIRFAAVTEEEVEFSK